MRSSQSSNRDPQRLAAAGVLLFFVTLVMACKAQSALDVQRQDHSAPTAAGPRQVASTVEPVDACPSQDFTEFLKAFANEQVIRERYTTLPLKYKLYSYVALDGNTNDNTPEWTVKSISTPDRSGYFTYRYDKNEDGYFFAGRDGRIRAVENAIQPIVLRTLMDGTVEVAVGAESEQDTFTFKRKFACWYFEQAQDYRS